MILAGTRMLVLDLTTRAMVGRSVGEILGTGNKAQRTAGPPDGSEPFQYTVCRPTANSVQVGG